MPIRIPDNLPARKTLEDEGVYVMDSARAARQDIRPLEIGLLNLIHESPSSAHFPVAYATSATDRGSRKGGGNQPCNVL